jgi:hypothetical protein
MGRGPKKKAQSPSWAQESGPSPTHSWVGLGWALGFVGFAEAYLLDIMC